MARGLTHCIASRRLIGPLAVLLCLACGAACVPEPIPSTPRGHALDPPPPRPRPPAPEPEPDPQPPPGPWPAPPPPDLDPEPQPHPLDPAPLPAPWPVGEGVAGVDFERTVIADERVVGFAADEAGLYAASASGGLFALEAPGVFTARPTPLPPLRGFVGGGPWRVACPADGAPARISTGGGWARLDVGCNPGGRRTVAIDKEHVFLIAGAELRDGRLPGLSRRRPAPVPDPRVVGANAGRVVIIGAGAAAVSDDSGATFAPARRADPPGLLEPRDIAITGKGRAVLVGRGEPGATAIEYSRDGGHTWRAAEGPDRLADDLAAVAVDARGVFYAAPRDPGPALRSLDGGRTWRAIDLRAPVGGALFAAAQGALVGAPRGLVAGLDRAAPRGPGLDRPLWRAVFTHPRIGVGVGVLGGIWRTLDGGGRWFLVPGTSGLPFTDLDRVDGHGLVAVGAGLFRRSDDAGGIWSVSAPPGSCEAGWVRFAGARGLAACGDGRPAVSDDGGRSWQRGEPMPDGGPPVWLDPDTAVALSGDGRVGWSTDAGARFDWAPAPARFVELAPAPEGASAIDLDGRVWRCAGPERPWQPGPRARLGGAPVAHHPLSDGRVLALTDAALYVIDPDGATRLIGPTPGARALTLPGDGAILVLQAGATTRFESR